MTNVKPIHSDTDYEETLSRIAELMDADPGTPDGDELEILTTLVTAYEDTHFPIDVPDPVTAIEFIMDQKGFGQKDFAALIGKSRASEVLNRKRSLSLNQAKSLYKEWGVPAEALLTCQRHCHASAGNCVCAAEECRGWLPVRLQHHRENSRFAVFCFFWLSCLQ